MASLSAIVHGRVQGVGYRDFVRRQAARWAGGRVANLPDGTVLVEASGPRAALETLVHALEEGPLGSRVARVEHSFGEGLAHHDRFEID